MQRIASELHLPVATRSRILLEMAADLEELYEHYRARGLDDEEAARQTEERMLASPETLQHLVAVHTTGYRRWLSRAAGRLRWGMDAVLFALGVAPLLVVGAFAVLAPRQGLDAPVLLRPLLAIGVVIAGITLWKAYQLLIRRVRSTAELHRGLFTLLFLGGVSPLVAGVAFLIGVHQLALGAMGGGGDDAVRLAAQRLAHDATVLAAGLLLGIAAALVWFVLANRIAVIEQEETAILLAVGA